MASITHVRLSAGMLALALFTGCGDAEEQNGDDNGPLYAITTQLLTADPVDSYVIVTDQAEQTASLSLDNAIRVSGRALGVGITKSGTLYKAAATKMAVTVGKGSPVDVPEGEGEEDSGGGCGAAGSAPMWGLMMVGLASFRRRQR